MKKSKLLTGSLAMMMTLGCVSGCDLLKKEDDKVTVQGEKGDKGEKGDAGSSWLTGTTNPTEEKGNNGDFYFNSVAQTIYFKENNVWLLKSDLSKKDIKTFEKIASTADYDTYKVTYEDDTTDTFNVKKGDIVTELNEDVVKELFDGAVYKSIHEDEVYLRIVSGDFDDSGIEEITFDESGLYCDKGNGNRYYYMFDDDSNKIIRYAILEGRKYSIYYEGSEDSAREMFWNGYVGYKEGILDVNLVSKILKTSLLDVISDYYYEINSSKINLETTYDYKNDKYILKVTASYSDKTVEGSVCISYKFSDRIEEMRVEYVVYDKDGEEKIENEEASLFKECKFKYFFEETLRKTDFSDFPAPEEE